MSVQLENYKEKYSKFVELIAWLHNTNVVYSSAPSYRNGYELRRILRQLRTAEKELWEASIKASKEVAALRGKGRPKKEKKENG
jgi:hypothetical protein